MTNKCISRIDTNDITREIIAHEKKFINIYELVSSVQNVLLKMQCVKYR